MPPVFRHHDLLRLFTEIARFSSFSDAAGAMHMTKGAISYQIKTLEADLGMPLFERTSRGVRLTREGQAVLAASRPRFEEIETELLAIKGMASRTLTVGVSTYFAARWLSPRLMSFLQDHQDVQLRIQPMVQFSERELRDVDLLIRWGNGGWPGGADTPFMPMQAFPVGNRDVGQQVREAGLGAAIPRLTLLRDRDDSTAWSDWLSIAGLPPQTRRDVLIVPDPNVRVQAVIDGQGIALMDDLVAPELQDGRLVRLSDAGLADYGYFLVRPDRAIKTDLAQLFSDWLQAQV